VVAEAKRDRAASRKVDAEAIEIDRSGGELTIAILACHAWKYD